jgi:hypothetical protein
MKFCAICNAKVGFFDSNVKIANNERVCMPCFEKIGIGRSMDAILSMEKKSSSDIKRMIERKEKDLNLAATFTATKAVGGYAEFDDIGKRFMIPKKRTLWAGKITNAVVCDYSEIVNFELLEDGESIVSGGLGRALVGGVLLGGVGSIVGGVTGKKESKSICTNLKIKITVNDMANPAIYIVFWENDVGIRKNEKLYKDLYTSAQECISIFQLICESQKPIGESTNYISNADEIMKYKTLLDAGAITQNEYDAKKKQLLGI